VQVATLFQNVVRANHPPSNVVKTVKKAVKHVKDHAETWDSRPFGWRRCLLRTKKVPKGMLCEWLGPTCRGAQHTTTYNIA
jgi:hypothetical protein